MSRESGAIQSALIGEIGTYPIGERVAFHYLLGNILFWSFAVYYSSLVGSFPVGLFLLEWIIVLVIVFFGTRYVFAINGKEAGRDFLARFICLSFPIAVKVFVIAEVALRVFYIALFEFLYPGILSDPISIRNLASFAWFPVAGIVFYWRLSVAFRKLVGGESPNHGFNRTPESSGPDKPGEPSGGAG